MSDYDIWVDYNGVGDDHMVTTMRQYGPEEMWIGRVLITGDHDGNTCPAMITDMTDQLVFLKLFMPMFKAAA